MIMLKSTLELLNKSIKDIRFECGGILGSSQNEIIDNVVFDDIRHQKRIRCSYAPNVEFLNKCILQWQQENIRFWGMFHTHFAGVKTLSEADETYIRIIMNAMPEEIYCLYFPIYVLPERELVGYVAKRTLGDIKIESNYVIIK